MRKPILAALAVAVGLASLAATSQTTSRDRARAHRQRERQSLAEVEELLTGGWRLTSIFDPSGFATNKGLIGYALIVDGFMAIDYRFVAKSMYDNDPEDFLESGTYRFDLDRTGGRMNMTLLFGTTNLTPNEMVLFQASGARRNYKVLVGETSLRLERLDHGDARGARFIFTRLQGRRTENLDMFGRPIPEPTEEELLDEEALEESLRSSSRRRRD